MKSLLAKISLILFLGVCANAQEPCLSDAPNIWFNSVRLGDSAEAVNNRLRLKIKIKTNDDFRYFESYVDRKPPVKLSGVRAIYLRFFEKRLYQIEIFYNENEYPSDIKNFAEIVSSKLGVSAIEWEFANRQAVYKCAEKSLIIDYQLNPRIEFTDETVRQKIAETRKKEKK